MSLLNKKTKAQLEEIARDLDVNIKSCKVKQALVDRLTDHFLENADKYDKDHEYYDYVVSVKQEAENENDDEDEDDNDDESDEAEIIDIEESDAYDSDDDFDLEPSTLDKILDYIDNDTLYEIADYVAEKNYELRDYLSDPFTINDFTVVGEFIYLYPHFAKSIALGDIRFVPQVVKNSLPAAVLKTPVTDLTHFLDVNFWSTVLLWLLVSYGAPKLTSYYVNFTYNFEYDPFIFALAKLLFGLILFKTEVSGHDIKDELVFQFSFKNYSVEYAAKLFKHYLLTSTLLLRNYFGNWVLIGDFFAAFVALYANLSFI
ncbi:hypothetical protein KL912_002644 [Ogataea haglerorum]|nr:hypothetical protein KL912_002644 [Ogataea haglerorum]